MTIGKASYRTVIALAAMALTSAPSLAAVNSPANGKASYMESCAQCHGAELQGQSGPALKSPAFVTRWTGHEMQLFETIQKTMPLGAPESLGPMRYHSIAAYLLKQNGIISSKTPAYGEAPEAEAAEAPLVVPPLPDAPKQLGTPTTSVPDDAELLHSADGDWLRYNHDYQGQRFSALNQITPDNVAQLVPKCMLQLGEVGSFEASPIVRAGRMYVTTAHHTYALDATNCRRLWSHNYVAMGTTFEDMPNNRGVALYKGMVIRGTLDGHVIALDAETGKPIWDTWVSDSAKGYFISAAPVAYNGKIYIGEAGGDYGIAGHIHALDATTGRSLWKFNIIPGADEPGGKSWPKNGERGGGAMWTTITVDPDTHSLYASTGNPSMDYEGSGRIGDNLYSDSVVVVDTETGKLKWYVQQNPHDVRDYDTTAAPVIYTVGKHNMMAVGSKDAHLYFYDRDTHKLVARRELTQQVNATGLLPIGKPTRVCPGTLGGVEWNGPAFDPKNSMVFVNVVDWCTTITPHPESDNAPGGGTMALDPSEQSQGWLRAFDATTGEERWHFQSSALMVAGITPTASGLLFTGTARGDFLAFEAKTGKQLFSFYTGGSLAGGVSTYLVGDKQYVAVASGNNSKLISKDGGSATVVIFGLP